jgi:Uroporphyrinogen decarboxylase (URO-D).
MILPRGFGGVSISDDDCTIISPHLYRTFVVPYNSRVFKAFGGGTLHYCGSATHQFENFLATDGLVGINNFCMGDFAQVFRAQQLFEDRVTMMVCDYTPLDIEGYFAELLAGLKPKGTILGTSPLATLAMVGRRVETRHRDPGRIGSEAWRVIRRNLVPHAATSGSE